MIKRGFIQRWADTKVHNPTPPEGNNLIWLMNRYG